MEEPIFDEKEKQLLEQLKKRPTMMNDTTHLTIEEQTKKALEYAKEEYNKDFHACVKGLKKKRGYCLANFDHFFPQGYKELWRRRLWNIHCEEEEI